jgi:hypothetical protein
MKKTIAWIGLLAAILFAFPSTSTGAAHQTGTNSFTPSGDAWLLETAGQAGGIPTDIAIQGAYAYVGVGSHLEILDITHPAPAGKFESGSPAASPWSSFAPIKRSQAGPLPEMIYAVAVLGQRAYAISEHRLYVFNVADPAAPVHTATLPGLSYATAVAPAGDHVYIADESRLWIVDVSNPSKPVFAGSIDFPEGVTNLTVSGDHAYIAGRNLYILDISDPAAPVLVGTGDSPRSLNSVAVAGPYAYATSYQEGLLIYDISDPARPTLAGDSDSYVHALDIAVSDGVAYLAVEWGGLRFVDISDPRYPFPMGRMDEYEYALRVAVTGSYAFLINSSHEATRANGVAIIDISDPAAPSQAGVYDPGGFISALDMMGNYAFYIGEQWNVNVVDLTTPAQPERVAGYDTPGYPWNLEISGHYAYFADGPQGLHIADISDPGHPTGVASLASIGTARDLELRGDYAYTIGTGLHMIDISVPASPIETGVENTFTGSHIVVEGDYAYVLGNNPSIPGNVHIFNITDQAHPTRVQSLSLESPGDIDASGNFLYIINNFTPRLFIYDVSNPASPSQVAAFPLAPAPQSVRVEGNVAYIGNAHAWGGLRILDVTDPHAPVEVCLFKTPGYEILDVIPLGNTLFVADGSNGLEILHIRTRDGRYLYLPAMIR